MSHLLPQNFSAKRFLKINACALTGLLGAGMLYGQAHDPGVRAGQAGAGGPYPLLNSAEQAFFQNALDVFKEVDSVSGHIEAGSGLGPTFNGNSCAQCHAFPAVGGTSPQINPQVANNFAHLDGALNPVDLSGFLSINGPVREVRFIRNPDGSADGGVHGIFTIAGRSDAGGCNAAQPNFPQQLAAHNMVFRIPTPVFGLGLLENVSDDALRANLAATAGARAQNGIGGRFNTSGNDGTITRFGWKAQNKSLEIFAGEAYNVEQGVSNELFPNERGTSPGCEFNATAEDRTNPAADGTALASDTVNFAAFMRLSAPPAPATSTSSQLNGQSLFNSIGCALCHSATLTTSRSPFTGMGNVAIHPYTDLAIHHMGATLADGVSQGGAGGDEFRTAPLWGIGQRVFFLHDGRTDNLLTAILAHASNPGQCEASVMDSVVSSVTNGTIVLTNNSASCGSEANTVVARFQALPASQQQDVLNFLRSL